MIGTDSLHSRLHVKAQGNRPSQIGSECLVIRSIARAFHISDTAVNSIPRRPFLLIEMD